MTSAASLMPPSLVPASPALKPSQPPGQGKRSRRMLSPPPGAPGGPGGQLLLGPGSSAAGFEADLVNPEGYEVNRSSESKVIDVWTEWKEGINGGPSIEKLEEARKRDRKCVWWRHKNDYKYWSKQMRIIHAIEKKAAELGGSLDAAIRYWEEILRVEFEGSISKLREALGGEKAVPGGADGHDSRPFSPAFGFGASIWGRRQNDDDVDVDAAIAAPRSSCVFCSFHVPPFSPRPFNSLQNFPSLPPLRLSSPLLLLLLMHSVPPLVALPEYPVLPLPLSPSVRICTLGSSWEWAMLRLELFLDSTVKVLGPLYVLIALVLILSSLPFDFLSPCSPFPLPSPPFPLPSSSSSSYFLLSPPSPPLASAIMVPHILTAAPHGMTLFLSSTLNPKLLPTFLPPPASAIVYLAFSLLLPMAYPLHTPAGMLHSLAAAWVSFNILFNFYCAATRNPGSPPPLAVRHAALI
ncbi:unnamed protein product [Closterium sp. NIES-65]|nr:unnamed protein product [Closterium sp. NIES-65]